MSTFKIDARQSGSIDVLEIRGYLDAHTSVELEKALEELITRGKFKIVVNCRGLSYISSAGLGVFMAFIEDVRKNHGDIKLSNLSAKVYSTFDLLGFPLLYDISKDESEAIAKFHAANG